MSSNKKIILAPICIILIILIVFLVKDNSNSKLRKLTIVEEIASRITSADRSIGIQSNANSAIRWVKDGYTILIPSSSNLSISKQSNRHLEFGAAPTLFDGELSIIDSVMKGRDYDLDKENSSKDYLDSSFYDYVRSYRREDELCAARVNPDDVGSYQLDFSCGNSLTKEYDSQIQFLKVLGLMEKKTAVKVMHQKGDYYEIGMASVRGGSAAILKKEGSTYRVIFIGQEAPRCSLVIKERIPSEVLGSVGNGSCFADDGTYIKK